jgi:hypothetical protein
MKVHREARQVDVVVDEARVQIVDVWLEGEHEVE